jgi:hypothetical protein
VSQAHQPILNSPHPCLCCTTALQHPIMLRPSVVSILVHLNSTNSMSGTLPQGSSGSPNAQTAHCHMPVSCNHVAAPPAQFKFAHHQLYYCQDLFERQIQFEFAHSSMSSQQTAWTVPLTASLANTAHIATYWAKLPISIPFARPDMQKPSGAHIAHVHSTITLAGQCHPCPLPAGISQHTQGHSGHHVAPLSSI